MPLTPFILPHPNFFFFHPQLFPPPPQIFAPQDADLPFGTFSPPSADSHVLGKWRMEEGGDKRQRFWVCPRERRRCGNIFLFGGRISWGKGMCRILEICEWRKLGMVKKGEGKKIKKEKRTGSWMDTLHITYSSEIGALPPPPRWGFSSRYRNTAFRVSYPLSSKP